VPKLDKSASLKLADRVIKALWELLKKKSRKSQLRYHVVAWADEGQLHSSGVEGYIVGHDSPTRRPYLVEIVGNENKPNCIFLVAGESSDFLEGSGQPRRTPGRDRVSIVPKAQTRREYQTCVRRAAELVLVALKFGRFDPDIVQRIGALDPTPPPSPTKCPRCERPLADCEA